VLEIVFLILVFVIMILIISVAAILLYCCMRGDILSCGYDEKIVPKLLFTALILTFAELIITMLLELGIT